MSNFSERMGLKSKKLEMQIKSMDDDLRIGLWNVLSVCYWDPFLQTNGYDSDTQNLILNLWMNHFKEPFDLCPPDFNQTLSLIRTRFFFKASWNEVYDFIEFISLNDSFEERCSEFRRCCNFILERELSAYRFTGKQLTQVTDSIELKGIEAALELPFNKASYHLKQAITHFSNRQSPDYRNSIKESISAVEQICRELTGESTLDKALKKLNGKVPINEQLKQGLEKIYHYTNGPDGIRHALMDDPNVGFTAFANYIASKVPNS